MSMANPDIPACVAIVDDDEETAQILEEFLESKGVSAECFVDAEAILSAAPNRFSAILLDICLPGMWGSECGYELRQHGYRGPIVAISGTVEHWDQGDLRDLGFTCALGKPLNPSELLDLLKEYILKEKTMSTDAEASRLVMPVPDPISTITEIFARYPALPQEPDRHSLALSPGRGPPTVTDGSVNSRSSSAVMGALDQAILAGKQAGVSDAMNKSRTSPAALTEHIENSHHAYSRAELPRLEELFVKILAMHGDTKEAMLVPMHATFLEMKKGIEIHMMAEEQILFPAIRRMEILYHGTAPISNVPIDSMRELIRQMEGEHDQTGIALIRMRKISSDYAIPVDMFPELAALFGGLVALEANLHHHFHLENTVLFPRAMAMEHAVQRRKEHPECRDNQIG